MAWMRRSTARSLGGIQIAGIEELRRQLDPRVFNYAFGIAHRRGALKMRQVAREVVPGKRFDDAILNRQLPSGLGAMVYTPAKSAESIHEGRRVGEVVSFRRLTRWVRRYGLASSVTLKTRRVRKLGKTAPEIRAVEAVAAVVQKRIERAGTKPIPFFGEAAVTEAGRHMQRYWNEALVLAVKKFSGRVA